MKSWKLLGAAALALAVTACGTNPQDRTTGGAAAGAAAGAGVGALGGPVGALAGAAIGGGVGAVTGATTSPRDVNLGRPVWNNPEVRTPADRANRSTRRSRESVAERRRLQNERDRAYMGGGAVGGEASGSSMPGNPAMTGGAGGPTMPGTGNSGAPADTQRQ